MHLSLSFLLILSGQKSLAGSHKLFWRLFFNFLKLLFSHSIPAVVMCLTLQSHGLQPPRLLCPWDSPGKNTGVRCHFLLQGIFPTQGSNPHFLCFLHSSSHCYNYAAAAESLQSCPTLCDPVDGSPPGSPVPGIPQARTLEWVAISFSNAWKGKVKGK